MLKTIANIVIAFMLFAFPIVFYIGQADGGNNNAVHVSENMNSEGNTIINSNLVQISEIHQNSDESSKDSSGGSSGGSSDGNSESSSGGSNGGSSDGSSGGSSVNDNSGGSSGGSDGGHSGGDSKASEETSGVSSGRSFSEESGEAGPLVVINKIYPCPGDKSGNVSIELYNKGDSSADLDGWYITNATGDIIGTIHDKEIAPYGSLVVEVAGLIGDSQKVTLYDSWGEVMDSRLLE